MNEFKRSSYTNVKPQRSREGNNSFGQFVYQDYSENNNSKPNSHRSSTNIMMAPGCGEPKQAVPGSGGGPSPFGSNMITDRRQILQQYLQDLIMIPAIKESNQLKDFIGIK